MKKLIFSLSVLFLAACSGNKEEQAIANIKALEKNASFAKSDTLINSYIRFSETFPTNKLAPVFLFKAAQVYVGSNRAMNGVKLFEKVANEYQSDSLAPQALINGGITYATLQDPANAKRLYDQFLKNYPNHPRFEEVKIWSETVGMSEDALINKFINEKLNGQLPDTVQ